MNAIILVDKPAGISSADVVRRIKARVKPARVGHLGTLDPFATGLLPIMIGEATKLAPFIDGGDKTYAGLIRLGTETDTLDRDGAVVRTAEVPAISPEKIAEVAARFTGVIDSSNTSGRRTWRSSSTLRRFVVSAPPEATAQRTVRAIRKVGFMSQRYNSLPECVKIPKSQSPNLKRIPNR